jgi:hypothetical protein
LLAQCLRAERIATDDSGDAAEDLEAHHFRWVNFN